MSANVMDLGNLNFGSRTPQNFHRLDAVMTLVLTSMFAFGCLCKYQEHYRLAVIMSLKGPKQKKNLSKAKPRKNQHSNKDMLRALHCGTRGVYGLGFGF